MHRYLPKGVFKISIYVHKLDSLDLAAIINVHHSIIISLIARRYLQEYQKTYRQEGKVFMDAVLMLFLIIGTIALATIPIFSIFIYSEVKKIRKEIVKMEFIINKVNTSILHQTSKTKILDKHLGIIGSKVAPDRYTRRSKRNR